MAQDPSGSSLDKSEMEDEFQFLLCQSCSEETGCPKLLPCLHNVCPKCLLETKPLNCCPVCKALHSQTEATSVQDNLLFANLRAKLSVFQLIKSGEDLVCNNCKKEGVYWCSDCQEFLCNVCFESHQRYLKRENHEAKPVKDIKADSSEEFLTEFKNIAVMFCPNPEHRTQHLSIYCKACQLPMCCICTVLDPQHNGERCHIREEIQRRQQELLSMNMELQEKKTSYDQTCGNLRELVNNMVEAKNKTNERIQQRVAQIVQLVQEKGTQLLASVQEQHQRQVRDTEEKLHNVELVSQRMESCKLLVEKMHLYASDQEVMDMYPFIKQSLEELKRQEPPMVETPIQMENFSEVEAELEAFYERVTKKKEPAPVPTKVASSQDSVEKAPVKRKSVQVSSSAQTPTKHIKIEPNDDEWKQSTGQMDVAQPGTSSGDRQLASGDTVGKGGDTEINSENWFSILSSESLGSAGQVQLDQPGPSSGVGNGDSVWNGADTVIISDDWFPVSSADSSITDTSSCLNGGGHDESSNDIESMGSVRQENISPESNQDAFWRNVFQPPKPLFSGQGSLVFFDLKVLPGRTIHLVAIADEKNFFSIIIPQLQLREGVKGGLREYGLETFLRYLLSQHRPILVGYDLWSMDFQVLVSTLKIIKKEEIFKEVVFGFLDALPLVQERVPDLPNYTLKSLDRKFFWGQLDDSSVTDCAKTLKDLCTVLDVNPGMDRRPVIPYSSLQSYVSLQPLLTKGILSRSTVQSLALHGVGLSVLFSVYKKDPAHGLEKFESYLRSRQVRGGGKIQQLSKVQLYFEALPSTSRALMPAATESEIHLCH